MVVSWESKREIIFSCLRAKIIFASILLYHMVVVLILIGTQRMYLNDGKFLFSPASMKWLCGILSNLLFPTEEDHLLLTIVGTDHDRDLVPTAQDAIDKQNDCRWGHVTKCKLATQCFLPMRSSPTLRRWHLKAVFQLLWLLASSPDNGNEWQKDKKPGYLPSLPLAASPLSFLLLAVIWLPLGDPGLGLCPTSSLRPISLGTTLASCSC